MKKNLIENEIKKMQSLISHRVGVTITEQEDDCPPGLTKVKTQCCADPGSVGMGVDRGKNEQNLDLGGAAGTNRFRVGKLVSIGAQRNLSGDDTFKLRAWGEFPSGGSNAEAIVTNFIAALQAEIDANPDVIDKEKYDVNIAVANINSSASNERNGPTNPTSHNWHPRFKQTATPPRPARYDKDNKQVPVTDDYYTGDDSSNETLAANRGKNLWSSLKKQLSGANSRIKLIMEPSINGGEPVFNSWVTDTGGCIDSRRDVTNYPNPGQYVTVEATLELVDKAADKQRRCLSGMKITVGYYAPTTAFDRTIEDMTKGLDDKKITQDQYDANLKAIQTEKARSEGMADGKTSKTNHACNRASFYFYLNDTRVGGKVDIDNGKGYINLNNAGPRDNDKGVFYKDIINPVTDNGVNVAGGSREGTLVVSGRQGYKASQEKNELGAPGSVVLSLRPLTTNSHNDVPWVKIETANGKVLMDKPADEVDGYNPARTSTGTQRLFGPFDPCEEI